MLAGISLNFNFCIIYRASIYITSKAYFFYHFNLVYILCKQDVNELKEEEEEEDTFIMAK